MPVGNFRMLKIPNGTCFLVPLKGGGFARGIVARNSNKGLMFGYFFGPALAAVCDLQAFENLSSGEEVMRSLFGDLGFRRKEWKILGLLPRFDQIIWELPRFLSETDDPEVVALTSFDEETLGLGDTIHVSRHDPLVSSCPIHGIMGYGFVETRLTQLLMPHSR
jgi:hypothetical protein